MSNETLSTVGTIAGLGLIGLSINELLSNPDRYQEVFGAVSKDIRSVREDISKVARARSIAKDYKAPARADMNRIDLLGQKINKRMNPMIEADLAEIERQAKITKKWSLDPSKLLMDSTGSPLKDMSVIEEAIRRTSRNMMNLPSLKMAEKDIKHIVEKKLFGTNGKDLLENVSSLMNKMEKELPRHQRAGFRTTFASEFAKQKSFLKSGATNDRLVSKTDMFEAWSKEEFSTRRFYTSYPITAINAGHDVVNGVNEILSQNVGSRLRNGMVGPTSLTEAEASLINRNLESLKKIYKDNINRPLNYKVHLVKDDVRGGFAVMADIRFRRQRAAFQVPLLANREADFGHGLDMRNAKGGITYEGASKRLYQSATVVPGELASAKGAINGIEDFMIRELDQTMRNLKGPLGNDKATKVLDIELKRQKDMFLDRTLNKGQRLIPNIKGTQAFVAVMAANQAVVTDPDFRITDQESIKTLSENKAIKILDLAPSSFGSADGIRVFQTDAPTIERQLLGFDVNGNDILPTDKTYSFRKTIELTGGPKTLGNSSIKAQTLPAKPRKSAIKASFLQVKDIDVEALRKQAKDAFPTNEKAGNEEFKRLLKEAREEQTKALQAIPARFKDKEEFDKFLNEKHKEEVNTWRENRSFIEERNRLNPTITEADLIGYNLEDPNVLATRQNKKFLPVIYQDGVLDAHFRLEYQMGEGLYMGKSYGFISDASTIKNISLLTDKWAKVWQEAKEKDSLFVPIDRLRSMGTKIGFNDAGNIMKMDLRGTNIRGVEMSVNPTTGDFIYRTVYDKGDFSKGKGLGVKGQVRDMSSESILRETAYAMGMGDNIEAGKKAAVSILGGDARAIISDMDQVGRGFHAMKEATLGGAAILLSNKDAQSWRGKINSFLGNLNGQESVAEYSKRVFHMLQSSGVSAEQAAFNIRGSFNSFMDPKADEVAAKQKWIETYGDNEYSLKAFAASRKQKGFLGGGTISFDTPSELGGAGKMASVERRAFHSMLVNLEHAGVSMENQATVMSDIIRRVDNAKMGNWKTTYETMNASFFSIEDPTYFNEKQLGNRIKDAEITRMKLKSDKMDSIMDLLESDEFKNSHLIEIDLKGTRIGDILHTEKGITSIMIPGARGIPDMERVQIKKDKATVTMTEEYIAARDNFLRTALDENATDDQVKKELYNLRNQLAVGASETIRQNMSGKVAGSAQGRFLTLMSDQFIDKEGRYRTSSTYNQMRKLAAADNYQTVFVKDAVLLQQVKGLKSSASSFQGALKEDSKAMAKEHIKNFFFKKGQGYNTGFFSRNPTLGEGHGILTKQRRYLENEVNSVILSNNKVKDLLTLMSGKEKTTSEERKRILMEMLKDNRNEEVEYKGAKMAAQDAFTEIVYEDVDKLHRYSLEEKGASIFTPMSKEKLTYKLSNDGGKSFKDETSKKLFYSRAYRAIGDSDGDVVSMLLGGSSEANKAMTDAIRDGNYASKMFRADIEFDAMNKRIAMTQAITSAGSEAMTLSERAASFMKNVLAKNVGQYSIAIDTLKSGILSKTDVDPIRRRQLVDLLLAIEENMLKAKKMQGKIENFGEEFATAIRMSDKESYIDLLEKRVAKFSDVDVVDIGGEKHTLKYGDLFNELWDSMQAYKANRGLAARSLKDVSNKVRHPDAMTEEKGRTLAYNLKALNEGRGSLINSSAIEAEDEIVAATPDPRASVAGSKVLAGNADDAAGIASTGVKKTSQESLFDRVFNKETLKWVTENRKGLAIAGGIAGIGLAAASIKGSQGQQSEPIIENPFREKAVIPRDQILQPETYIQMDTGRANVELAGLQSLPGVSNALASSGIRKQALVLSDNRPPITKSYVDKRER